MLTQHLVYEQSVKSLTLSHFNAWFSFSLDKYNYKTSSLRQDKIFFIGQIGMGSINYYCN